MTRNIFRPFQGKKSVKSVMENNYHEMKPLNSTQPAKEWEAPATVVDESEEKPGNGEIPSESTPMLPSDDTFPLGKLSDFCTLLC